MPLTFEEETVAREILRNVPEDAVFSLASTVSRQRADPASLPAAEDVIIQLSKSLSELLRRAKMKREYLVHFAYSKEIINRFMINSAKTMIADKILKYVEELGNSNHGSQLLPWSPLDVRSSQPVTANAGPAGPADSAGPAVHGGSWDLRGTDLSPSQSRKRSPLLESEASTVQWSSPGRAGYPMQRQHEGISDIQNSPNHFNAYPVGSTSGSESPCGADDASSESSISLERDGGPDAGADMESHLWSSVAERNGSEEDLSRGNGAVSAMDIEATRYVPVSTVERENRLLLQQQMDVMGFSAPRPQRGVEWNADRNEYGLVSGAVTGGGVVSGAVSGVVTDSESPSRRSVFDRLGLPRRSVFDRLGWPDYRNESSFALENID